MANKRSELTLHKHWAADETHCGLDLFFGGALSTTWPLVDCDSCLVDKPVIGITPDERLYGIDVVEAFTAKYATKEKN